jgi:hypothetical protein
LIVEAVNHLKVRSCLIDGEAVCCNEGAWRCSRSSGGSAGQHPAQEPGEHPEGDVVFQHACKMGLKPRLALQVGTLVGLAQVHEPSGACGQA